MGKCILIYKNSFSAKVIPKDLVEYDTLEIKMRVIPSFKKGPWDHYELENYVKVYNIVRFMEEVYFHNEVIFWNRISQRLYRLGIYRDADSCKQKVNKVDEIRKPLSCIIFEYCWQI